METYYVVLLSVLWQRLLSTTLILVCYEESAIGDLSIDKGYRPQKRRGHATDILFCVPSKLQTWFITLRLIIIVTSAVWTDSN